MSPDSPVPVMVDIFDNRAVCHDQQETTVLVNLKYQANICTMQKYIYIWLDLCIAL